MSSVGNGESSRRRGSTRSGWWNRILTAMSGDNGSWFSTRLRRVIGNGADTKFWEDRWCGNVPLKEMFPRFFHLTVAKEATVREMGRWEKGLWTWDLKWRRQLADRELERLSELLNVVGDVNLRRDVPDIWCWGDDDVGDYSIKKGYSCIAQKFRSTSSHVEHTNMFREFWKTIAPFKHQIVAWRALRNCLPTRDNLSKRIEIPLEDRHCPCCKTEPESANHILFRCKEVATVWCRVMDWLGVSWVEPNGTRDHFTSFSRLVGGKRWKKILGGMWTCVIWVIWRWRNKIIFENWEWDIRRIDEEIKRRLWSWCVVKGIVDPRGSFLEWTRQNLCSRLN